MTKRERLFIEEYLKDFNATAATIRAGYGTKHACNIGSRLLKRPDIKELVEAALKAREKRLRLDSDQILSEIEKMAMLDVKDFADVRTVQDLAALPEYARKAITGWKHTEYGLDIKFAKEWALGMLCKHLGIDRTKLELSGSVKLEDIIAGSK